MNKKTKIYHYKGYLFWMYELLELSTSQIAKRCGVSDSSTIRYWLRKHNIRIRTISEARKKAKNLN